MERGALRIHPYGLAPEMGDVPLPWPWSLVKAALDPAVVVAAYALALQARAAPITPSDLVFMVAAALLLFRSEVPMRHFSGHVLWLLAKLSLRVLAAAGALWAASLAFSLPLQVDPGVAVTWLALTPLALLALHSTTAILARSGGPVYLRRKAVVVGMNEVGRRVANSITKRAGAVQQFVGYFDDRDLSRLAPEAAKSVIGALSDVGDYVKSNRIDIIYISLPMATQPRVLALLQALRDTTASVYFVPDVFVADLIQGRVTTLDGMPLLSVCETPLGGASGAIKRAIDLLLVAASLPLVVPLLLGIALAVRLSSPGPALFTQKRYGLGGEEIVVLKFRTMTAADDGRQAFEQVTRGDKRVTRVGALLRRTSLDELPQLINVLLGTMSLVGPRPHALSVNEQFRKLIPGYMVRHKVRPGITGWAQVNGCRGGDDLASMERRTQYDLEYLRSWSIALDLEIIVRTIKLLVVGDRNAY